MEKLTDFEMSIVEQVLRILKTCERDYVSGIGYYKQGEEKKSFIGLCSLVRNLTVDTKLLKSLYNYLPSYTGPKNHKRSVFWFAIRGFKFFEERILFLEYVLQLNKETEDDKAKEY